jgi:hypothetical protein
MKSTLQMSAPTKAETETKKISVRRAGDIRLTTAAMCGCCYGVLSA